MTVFTITNKKQSLLEDIVNIIGPGISIEIQESDDGQTVDVDTSTLDTATLNALTAFIVIKSPGNPVLLTVPVSVTNSTVPQGLSELETQLEPNTKYEFRFRITHYNSQVPMNIGFAAPGDEPADLAADATMDWNTLILDGVPLGVDDEYQAVETGADLIMQEVSGTITTNSLGGLLIPQFRQSAVDATATEVTEAYMEVVESG